jgi:hypothetical protein
MSSGKLAAIAAASVVAVCVLFVFAFWMVRPLSPAPTPAPASSSAQAQPSPAADLTPAVAPGTIAPERIPVPAMFSQSTVESWWEARYLLGGGLCSGEMYLLAIDRIGGHPCPDDELTVSFEVAETKEVIDALGTIHHRGFRAGTRGREIVVTFDTDAFVFVEVERGVWAVADSERVLVIFAAATTGWPTS